MAQKNYFSSNLFCSLLHAEWRFKKKKLITLGSEVWVMRLDAKRYLSVFYLQGEIDGMGNM